MCRVGNVIMCTHHSVRQGTTTQIHVNSFIMDKMYNALLLYD